MAMMAIVRSASFAVLLVASVLIASVAFVQLRYGQQPNYCRMTYMRPAYLPISLGETDAGDAAHETELDAHGKYKLYLYREAELMGSDAYGRLGVGAVLFIPGNGGSYQQVGVGLVAPASERMIEHRVLIGLGRRFDR